MDKPYNLPQSAHLLDDLESIRQLLGDDDLQPPLLTETVKHDDEQIPLLFELADERPGAAQSNPEPVAPPAAAPLADDLQHERNRQDTLLHLDAELRAAAQMIMQDVIDDFAPHIEAEVKRRLEARLERLLGN
jgi:hypothetical protein